MITLNQDQVETEASYGIDAPIVVGSLFLISVICLAFSLSAFLIKDPTTFWIFFLMFAPHALIDFMIGCWMLYGIKIGKPKIAKKVIANLHLKGSEKLLDVGCGRGLLLFEAAKKLPFGEAHGIDFWSNKDQSGNSLETTLENARKEGVEKRVTIHTGDATTLPFADKTFDVIVSSLCFHNINHKNEREKALSECIRSLKPGGRIVIVDFRYGKEYVKFLMSQGLTVHCSQRDYSYCPPVKIIEGNKAYIQ